MREEHLADVENVATRLARAGAMLQLIVVQEDTNVATAVRGVADFIGDITDKLDEALLLLRRDA